MITTIKADKRHQSKAEYETEQCADEDSVVVDHWNKQADHQHTDEEDRQHQACPLPTVSFTVDQILEEECREDPSLGACRSDLQHQTTINKGKMVKGRVWLLMELRSVTCIWHHTVLPATRRK